MVTSSAAEDAFVRDARERDALARLQGQARLVYAAWSPIVVVACIAAVWLHGGPSFSALLKDAVGSVLDAGKKSDAQSMAMTSGKANVMDVVTAVAETDVAVSTLVSVRDRVIQSYEDIMKMPI